MCPYIIKLTGNLTAARYQHEVLDTEVIQVLRNHRGMQLLHDGAPAHRLNHRVRRTGAIPTTMNQLRANIFYEWNNLPQNYVQRYMTSMRRRCLAVVNSAGVYIRY